MNDDDPFDWIAVDRLIATQTNERGYLRERLLPDGRRVAVMPLTFARGRIVIGRASDPLGYDDGW